MAAMIIKSSIFALLSLLFKLKTNGKNGIKGIKYRTLTPKISLKSPTGVQVRN